MSHWALKSKRGLIYLETKSKYFQNCSRNHGEKATKSVTRFSSYCVYCGHDYWSIGSGCDFGWGRHTGVIMSGCVAWVTRTPKDVIRQHGINGGDANCFSYSSFEVCARNENATICDDDSNTCNHIVWALHNGQREKIRKRDDYVL